MSIQSALAAYAGDGWVLASNQQVVDLFNNFVGQEYFSAEESSRDFLTNEYSSYGFIEVIGVTDIATNSNGYNNVYGAYAHFGSDIDGDGLYKGAIAHGNGYGSTPYYGIQEDYYGSTDSDPVWGVALVRGRSDSLVGSPVSPVPEAETYAMLSLGAIGLYAFRRRKIKESV